MLSAFIEEEQTLNRINRIIDEEKRHVRLLQDFRAKKETLPIHQESS
jgi:hypothetical protein